MVFRVWGDAASPPLHLLHGFYGVGAVVGPFVAVPFLSPETAPNTTCISNSSFADCSSMEIPFWISGSLMLVSAGSMVVIYLVGAVTMAAATPSSVLQVCSPKACTANGPVASTVVLLVVFCLVYFFLMGGQFIVAAYFFTYLTTRQDDPLGKQQSSVIMGGYNAAFLVGRLSASGISKIISIKVMVLTEVVICAISAAGLFWLGSQHLAALWVFVLLIGGFSAPVWPGSMTFLGQYLVITTMTFFVLTFGMGCGNFFFNWLVGYIFQEYSVEDILIVVMLCYIMVAAMSFAIFGVGSRVNELKQKKLLQDKQSVNGFSNHAFEEQYKDEITKL
jgi:FHS family Na+ dependent glucose MFS transporter 1